MRRLVFALATCGVATAASLALSAAPSCQTYVPPPTAALNGEDAGIVASPNAPIVLTFSTPVVPATVSVQIAPFDIDAYGNLPDERPDGGSLDVLASHGPGGDVHMTSVLSSDGASLTMTLTPLDYLPIGPSLVLLVDPGLTSATTGAVLHYRQRIPFAYPIACGGVHATSFKSGAYFFLLNVEMPISVTLKVFADIDVNASSGAFIGQFTAALRNGDEARCDPPCTGGLVCELIPSQQCVLMSAPPVSVYESPDYLPKATAPEGYTFEMHGCAVDEGDAGVVSIVTAPGELVVSVPSVTIQGLTFNAQFSPADGGLEMGSGTLAAAKTYLGTTPVGAGVGTLAALSIPDAEVPPGLPPPTAPVDAGAADGGSDGGEAADGAAPD